MRRARTPRGVETVRRETADREIEVARRSRTSGEPASGPHAPNYPAQPRAPSESYRSAAGDKLRTVLESLNGDRPPADPALLLEVVKAPPALEPALRAVLGDQLDAVIVESPLFRAARDRNPQGKERRTAELYPRRQSARR